MPEEMMCKWAFIPPGKLEEKSQVMTRKEDPLGKNLEEVARDGQHLKVPLRYFMTAVIIPSFMDEETNLNNVK